MFETMIALVLVYFISKHFYKLGIERTIDVIDSSGLLTIDQMGEAFAEYEKKIAKI